MELQRRSRVRSYSSASFPSRNSTTGRRGCARSSTGSTTLASGSSTSIHSSTIRRTAECSHSTPCSRDSHPPDEAPSGLPPSWCLLSSSSRNVSRSRSAVTALANRAPGLADLWRYSTALSAARLPVRPSYSQHGEDVWLLGQVRDLPRDRFRYVDVGANHPARLSNTYLLYRHGFSGVVIEPNEKLLGLHRRFRPRDITVRSACGEHAKLGRFYIRTIAGVSSLSGASARRPSSRVRHVAYVPVLPLDSIV